MLSRRKFLELGTAAATVASVKPLSMLAASIDNETHSYLPIVQSYVQPATGPNVLFISIDDLNDWVGCLGGYPLAVTPNIDKLANRGVLFERAYCAVPMCNGSRVALMTSSLPSTSGLYRNGVYFRDSKTMKNKTTLPEYCMRNGYRAFGAGKLYCSYMDPPSWDDYWPSMDQQRPGKPRPPKQDIPLNGIYPQRHLFDWGPLKGGPGKMDDYKVASQVEKFLSQDYDRPFFMACGFYDCHLPWYVPREYYERFDGKAAPPHVLGSDLSDVPSSGRGMAIGAGEHTSVVQHDQWENAVQSYLACMSFVDDQVGRVIDALNNSQHRDNTIVVLWSDHGWHLGEKQHWKKRTLWEDATRNILLFAGPGIEPSTVSAPVSMIDVYPTVVELCGLKQKDNLEGKSLVPLLEDPERTWTRPAIMATVSKAGMELEFAVRSGQYRYIRYHDGAEELYDIEADEHEWINLADDPKYKSVKRRLAKRIPKNPAPALQPTKLLNGIRAMDSYELEMMYD